MRVPRGWHDCGTCKACDGTGQCASTPPDDNACGITDCDKLDTACKDYHDLLSNRCDSLGICKQSNTLNACNKFAVQTCADAGTSDASSKNDNGPRADAGTKEAGAAGCSCGLGTASNGSAHGLTFPLALFFLSAVVRRRRYPPA